MVVEIGLVAALLDGKLPEEESTALVTAIRLLPGLRDISDEEVNQMLMRASQRTQKADRWSCHVSKGLTNPALRRVAFRLAAVFCAWDGVIDDNEQGYLNWLASAFELSDDDAMRLFAEATAETMAPAGPAS
jgi:hypothetical protein